ncbi:MAG: DNA polymerase III subunit beta [bacterium]|nr:DNA polymerase III subunit beta [bacterium]
MKFICTTTHLKQALGNAERFTGKNITLPILANVLLEVDQNTLKVTATNLESAIQATVHGSGVKSGKVCVPVKVLSLFVQSVGDEKIQIEERQGSLVIKTDTRDTRINGVAPDDFPLIPQIKKAHSFTIASSLFSEGLGRVLPSVSTSEFKPELGGVFVSVSPMSVRMAATDTFRLAEKTISFESRKPLEPFSFILPHRISQEVARAFNGDEEVTISIGENQILFESDGCMVVSRLTEGNFPEYSAIIPKNFEVSCFLQKDAFMNAVRASSIFASKLQEVTTTLKSQTIEVKSLNQDVGEYKNTIACSATSPKEVTIGFNYRYLLDGLQATNEDEIFFGVNGDQSPSLIKNKSDSSFVYVVMPIRLS